MNDDSTGFNGANNDKENNGTELVGISRSTLDELPQKSWETEVNVQSEVVKVTVKSMSRLFDLSRMLCSKKMSCEA